MSHAEAVEEDDHGHEHGTRRTGMKKTMINHDIQIHDSHVWLSPVISQDLALAIKDELVTAMPEQEATFTKNYETLVAELE